MAPPVVDPSYDSQDLSLLEERQKLVLALEKLDLAAGESGQPEPTPVDQYRFLIRLLHVKPCQEYLNVLEAHFTPDSPHKKTDLNFERTYVGHTHWIAIFLTLPGCVGLQKFNACKQRLTSMLVEMMCDALVCLPALFSLDVSFNPFGSTGVKALVRLAKRKPHLVFCGFNGIHCISKLGRELEEAITRNRLPFLAAAERAAREAVEVQGQGSDEAPEQGVGGEGMVESDTPGVDNSDPPLPAEPEQQENNVVPASVPPSRVVTG